MRKLLWVLLVVGLINANTCVQPAFAQYQHLRGYNLQGTNGELAPRAVPSWDYPTSPSPGASLREDIDDRLSGTKEIDPLLGTSTKYSIAGDISCASSNTCTVTGAHMPGAQGQFLGETGPGLTGLFSLSGDASSTAVPGKVTVTGVQGVPWSSQAPAGGQCWVFNASSNLWVPNACPQTTSTGGILNGSTGSYLNGLTGDPAHTDGSDAISDMSVNAVINVDTFGPVNSVGTAASGSSNGTTTVSSVTGATGFAVGQHIGVVNGGAACQVASTPPAAPTVQVVPGAGVSLTPVAALPDWPGATTPVQSFWVIRPSAANAGGYIFISAITGNGDTGATEPSWPQTVGASIVDGGVTWTNISAPHTYAYEYSYVDNAGGSGPASTPSAAVTNGVLIPTLYNVVTIPAATGAWGWRLWQSEDGGAYTRVATGITFGAPFGARGDAWQGSDALFPATPPATATADLVLTTISGISGTTWTLGAALSTSGAVTILPDDSAAIQSALNAAIAAGGAAIYFPAGTYDVVDQEISATNVLVPIRIYGAGQASKIRWIVPYFSDKTTPVGLLNVEGTATADAPAFELDHLYLDFGGSRPDDAIEGARGVNLQGVDHVSVHDDYFRGCRHETLGEQGFGTPFPAGLVAYANTFFDWVQDAISPAGNNVIVEGNHFKHGGRGIEGGYGSANTFSDNDFADLLGNPVQAAFASGHIDRNTMQDTDESDPGYEYGVIESYCSGCDAVVDHATISGNVIARVNSAGHYYMEAIYLGLGAGGTIGQDVAVSDNRIDGLSGGVSVCAGNAITIAGNTVTGTPASFTSPIGLSCGSAQVQHVIVRDNVLSNPVGDATATTDANEIGPNLINGASTWQRPNGSLIDGIPVGSVTPSTGNFSFFSCAGSNNISYASTMTPDLSKGCVQTLTVSSTSAFSIATPVNPPTGVGNAMFVLRVANTAGAAIATPTWGAGYMVVPTPVMPSAGLEASWLFYYDTADSLWTLLQ